MVSLFFIALAVLAFPVYYLLFAFKVSRRVCVIPEGEQTAKTVNYFAEIPIYKSLNYGAFMFTPVWLFINGFWLTLLFYSIALFNFWPLALFFSLFFLLFGSRLSWARGERWNYNIERFLDSQSLWSFIAIVHVGVFLVLLLLDLFIK
ncbi:MAG: hypothetical protein V3U71_07870 [Cocleimonas sp.]